MQLPDLLNIVRQTGGPGEPAIDVTALAQAIDLLTNYTSVMGLGYFHITDPQFMPPADVVNGDWSVAIMAASQAAIDRIGGVVYFPWKTTTYKISCPYVRDLYGVDPNCQIPLPLCTFPTDINAPTQLYSLKWMGEVEPNFSTEGTQPLPRNQAGIILESTVMGEGVRPSVVGSPFAFSGVTGTRNFLKFSMENMIIRTKTMQGSTHVQGTTSALNLSRLIQCKLNNVKVDVSSPLINTVEPGDTVGIWYPDFSNKAELDSGFVMAEGYGQGLLLGEHTVVNHAIVVACVKGIVVPNGYTCTVVSATMELNRINYAVENGNLNVLTSSSEHWTADAGLGSKWYDMQQDATFLGNCSLSIINNLVRRSSGGKAIFTAPDGVKVLFGDGANQLPDDKARYEAEKAEALLSPYFYNSEFSRTANGNTDQAVNWIVSTSGSTSGSVPGNGSATITNGTGAGFASAIQQRSHGVGGGVSVKHTLSITSVSGSIKLINEAGATLGTWSSPGTHEVAYTTSKVGEIFALIGTGNTTLDYWRLTPA